MKEMTQKRIIEGHKYSSQYKNGLSNHLPMALYSLDALEASDQQISSFYDRYIKKLEFCEKAQGNLSSINLSQSLSRSDIFLNLVSHFRQQIKLKGINAVLNGAFPILFKGVSGGAFHPLIRLAFSLEMKNDDEISHALASWAVAYQELKGNEQTNLHQNLLESLLSLRDNKSFAELNLKHPSIFRRMFTISKQKGQRDL